MTTLPGKNVVKKVDAQGRLSLGKIFANHLVLLREVEDGALEIMLADVIPAKEAWLHKNKPALASLMRGLEQTAKGEFAEPPNLEEDAKLLAEMGD